MIGMIHTIEKKIYAPLYEDSPNAQTLRRLIDLLPSFQPSERQLNRLLGVFGLVGHDGEIFPIMAGGATPVIMTDASTPLNAANLNKYLNVGNADKAQAKMLYAHIKWSTGTTFIVDSAEDSAGLVDGDLSWDGGNDRVDIAHTSEFTNVPIALAFGIQNSHELRWSGGSISVTKIRYYDFSGTLQATPGASHTGFVMIVGQ